MSIFPQCATWVRALTLSLILAVAQPVSALAQSAYVPLDDVAYVYIDALLARRELRSLSVLGRPYTVGAILNALGGALDPRPRTGAGVIQRRRPDGAAHSPNPAVRDLSMRLLQAIAKYEFADRTMPAEFRAQMSASLWTTGETSGRRELMLGDKAEERAYAGGALRLLMAGGPVVSFLRPILENRLNTDPEFAGRKDRRIAGRTEDAYITAQWRYLELFFGRAARNWGPYAAQGLMVSDAPYTYDHAYARFGVPQLNGEVLLARLDNDRNENGVEVQRYVAAHRLSGRWRWLEGSVGESIVYSGPGRGFEVSLANPLSVYSLAWRNERVEGNLMADAQLAARTRLGIFSGELLVDDIQIDRCDDVCREPSSYGLTFSAEGLRVPLEQRVFASYTRVSSLTYRTPTPAERYTMFDVGLGRGYSDYDEWRVGLDAIVLGAPIRAYFASRRQGAGHYTLPFPPEEQYGAHAGIFEQPVAQVRRLGVSGGRAFGEFDVVGDVGYNWVSSEGLTLATAGDKLEGRIRMAWNPSWSRRRLAP